MVSDKPQKVHILHRETLTMRRWMSGQSLVLFPLLLAAVFVYGMRVLLPLVGAVSGAVVADLAVGKLRKIPGQWRNLSAPAAGLLLALLLPPATPFYLALLGGAFTILLGRELFGGLGGNIIHEAVTGKLALLLVSGTVIRESYLQPFWWGSGGWLTSWHLPEKMSSLEAGGLLRLYHQASDYLAEIVSGESAELAMGLPEHISRSAAAFKLIASVPTDQFWLAHAGGLIGEVSIAAILFGHIWLSRRRVFNWELPLLGLISFALVNLISGLFSPLAGGNFLYYFAIGEFWLMLTLFGTDTVTAPLTRRGRLLAGIVLGSAAALLTSFITPDYEPFLLALLLMNLLTPPINLLTLPRGRFSNR
jgi:Na+-translocating ferredoxin:NAD+ oxidoreductase subunit D